MAIDTTPSQVATSALQAIPFGSIIGGPLKACIEAQAMAAQTSWQFIQEVGLNTDPNTGQKEAVNVSFQFMQNGHMVQLNVPLLTIYSLGICYPLHPGSSQHIDGIGGFQIISG